jgi:hypothetical protein
MALTITSANLANLEEPERVGRYLVATRKWTLSGTYATGGHAYSDADVVPARVKQIVEVEFPDGVFRNGTNAIVPAWDPDNKKIMFFWQTNVATSPLIEVAATTSLASYVGRVRFRYLG